MHMTQAVCTNPVLILPRTPTLYTNLVLILLRRLTLCTNLVLILSVSCQILINAPGLLAEQDLVPLLALRPAFLKAKLECLWPHAGARSSGASAGPSSSGRGAVGGGSAANAGGQLWVEKHKPTNSAELVGNGTLVATLRTFLQGW